MWKCFAHVGKVQSAKWDPRSFALTYSLVMQYCQLVGGDGSRSGAIGGAGYIDNGSVQKGWRKVPEKVATEWH